MLRRISIGATALALVALAVPAGAATLTAEGSVLDDVKVAAASAVVTATIDLNGDKPEATYVMASMPDGRRMMRGDDGYWRNWDGRPESLIDNHFTAAGGNMVFKVLKEDLSKRFFPINVTVAYKAGGTFKFGVFQVVPE